MEETDLWIGGDDAAESRPTWRTFSVEGGKDEVNSAVHSFLGPVLRKWPGVVVGGYPTFLCHLQAHGATADGGSARDYTPASAAAGLAGEG